MSVKNWVKGATLSAMLGFGVAANAQDAETETPAQDTETQQQANLSSIKVDNITITVGSTEMPENMARLYMRGLEINDAQDVKDFNNRLQDLGAKGDRSFKRMLMVHARMNKITYDPENPEPVTVQGYDGDTLVANFGKDDYEPSASTNEAQEEKPTINPRSRSRRGGSTPEP